MKGKGTTETRMQAGFTLIELMAAAMVLVILAAMAWPSYTEHVRRARRAEAIAVLMESMQQQERVYSQRNRYLEYSHQDPVPDFKWYSGASPERSSHEISAHPCGDQTLTACVELRAAPGTPAVDASFRDPSCRVLSLTSAGQRTPADPSCWK